jgi:hypothetical protein
MLTRKHFIELSSAFRKVNFRSEAEREIALLFLVKVLAETNPDFDEERFRSACR